jgi:hypothetical protein
MFVSEIDWYAQPLFTNLVSGLLGAVIGSVLSTLGVAWSAFEVQKREFAKRRDEARNAEQANQRALVQAISDEIDGFWKFYSGKVGFELDALEELKIASVFPIDQSYFVIFDASAASIGGLPDADLRTKIIQFYVSAKSMVDSLRDYGRLVRDLSQPITTPTSVPASIQRIGRETYEANARIGYSKRLQNSHNQLSDSYKVVCVAIDRYLITGLSGHPSPERIGGCSKFGG